MWFFVASCFLKDVLKTQKDDITAEVFGYEPAGIYVIASTFNLAGGKAKIFEVDSIPEQLMAAEKLGAILIALSDDPITKIKAALWSRSAAVVVEFVGHADAEELVFELIRPFDKISCVGVHNEQIISPGFALYPKNITMAFGKCLVRSLFGEALGVSGVRGEAEILLW